MLSLVLALLIVALAVVDTAAAKAPPVYKNCTNLTRSTRTASAEPTAETTRPGRR